MSPTNLNYSHIALVITDRGPGEGGAHRILDLLNDYVLRDYNSRVIVLFTPGNKFLKLFRWPLAILKIILHSRSSKSPVIISNLNGSLYACLFAKLFIDFRWIHIFHGPPISFVPTHRKMKIYRILEELCVKSTNINVFLCNSQENLFVKQYNLQDCHRGWIIHNPIVNQGDYSYNTIRGKKQIAAPRKVILHPGRLCDQKNQIFSLKLARYRKDIGKNDLIVFAGSGHLNQTLSDYCDHLSLKMGQIDDTAADIVFLGHVNNLKDLMHAADVCILPSLYEGYPLVIIEALLLLTPVIASDCPTGPSDIKQSLSEIDQLNLLSPLLTIVDLASPSSLGQWSNAIDNSMLVSTDKSSKAYQDIVDYWSPIRYKKAWISKLMQDV